MALLDLPSWTVAPDWRNPVLERLEWKASVLASPSGSEQRFGLRLAPKRTFEFAVTVFGRERTLLDLSIGRVGMGEWYLPIWHDGASLTAAASGGAVSLSCSTVNREFRVGDAALLRDRDSLLTERVEVTSVAADAIGIAGETAISWPAGARIYPMRRARMMDKASLTRRADRAMQGNVLFLCTEPDDWTPFSWPDAYNGYPVLTYRPDESTDLTVEYMRLAAMFDDELAAPTVVDISDIGFNLQQHNFWMRGRAEHAELRSILYALRGRQKAVWMPTHYADLDLLADASGTSLLAGYCGFTAYGGPRVGRQHIRIERSGGGSSHHAIVGASETVGGDEALTISPALDEPLSVADCRRISFMQLARLDTDALELSHVTDSDGLCTLAAAFRSTPETRNAAMWEPGVLSNTLKTDGLCGEETGCGIPDCTSNLLVLRGTVQATTGANSLGTLYHRFAVKGSEWTLERQAAFAARSTGLYESHIASNDFFEQLYTPCAAIVTGTGYNDLTRLCGYRFIGIAETHGLYQTTGFGGGSVRWGLALLLIGWFPDSTPTSVDAGRLLIDSFSYHTPQWRSSDNCTLLAGALTSSGTFLTPCSGGGYLGVMSVMFPSSVTFASSPTDPFNGVGLSDWSVALPHVNAYGIVG